MEPKPNQPNKDISRKLSPKPPKSSRSSEESKWGKVSAPQKYKPATGPKIFRHSLVDTVEVPDSSVTSVPEIIEQRLHESCTQSQRKK